MKHTCASKNWKRKIYLLSSAGPPQFHMETTPKENSFKETSRFLFFAAVIILAIRFFVIQPFVVSGESMDPTFANREYLIVDEISYRFENPNRGDIVIFRYPYSEEKKYFIKRVIGLPKETLEINGPKITIYNVEHPDGFILKEPYIAYPTPISDRTKITLGDSEYFVMGDNRPHSSDSRSWGPLQRSYIVGRPLVRLLPIKNLSFLPGHYSQ